MHGRSWDSTYDRLEVLRERLAPESMTRFALRFALAHPVVSSLIIGLNTVAQVDQVIDAAEEPLEGDLFDTPSESSTASGTRPPSLPRKDNWLSLWDVTP